MFYSSLLLLLLFVFADIRGVSCFIFLPLCFRVDESVEFDSILSRQPKWQRYGENIEVELEKKDKE